MLQNGIGGHVKLYPYEKGGVKSFSHSERGEGRVEQNGNKMCLKF